MSDRKRPDKGQFKGRFGAVAWGKAAWDRLEQELAAATDLTEHEKDEILTDAQCRRIEQLDRNPPKDANKLLEELAALPPLTDGTRRFIGERFREQLVEGAILEGLRARGKSVARVDDARDISALYTACHPRDGAESALARLVPMLLYATTGCLKRAEDARSPEIRYTETTNAFRGARVLALISDSLHKDRPERSRKTK